MKRMILIGGFCALVLAGVGITEVLALESEPASAVNASGGEATELPYPAAASSGFQCIAFVSLPGNCDRSCCDKASFCCLETHNRTAGVKYQVNEGAINCTEDQVGCDCGFSCKCITRCGFNGVGASVIFTDTNITGQPVSLCGTVGNARDCDISCVCPGTSTKCGTTTWACIPF